MSDRALPNSPEAETAILWLLQSYPDARADIFGQVIPTDFYSSKRRAFYEAAFEMFEAFHDVEPMGCIMVMKENGVEHAGDILRDFDSPTAVPSSLPMYVKALIDQAERRDMIQASQRAVNQAHDPQVTNEEIVAPVRDLVDTYLDRRTPSKVVGMREATKQICDEIDATARGNTDAQGYSTGYPTLDEAMSFGPGLHVIAGRPSMGKTSLALNMCYRLGKAGIYSLVNTLEQTEANTTASIIASSSRLNLRHLIERKIQSDVDMQRFLLGMAEVEELPIDMVVEFNIDKIIAKIRRTGQEHKRAICVVDYLQLVNVGMASKRFSSREGEVSYISRRLKECSMETRVPIIAIAQLNRSAEKRSDNRPMLSDLRESGAIEQDADTVTLLYCDGYYSEERMASEAMEIIVAKNRTGPVGTKKLVFMRDCVRFEEMATGYGIPEDYYE